MLHAVALLMARALSGANATVNVRQQARLAAREGELALVEAAAASSVTQAAALLVSIPLVAALAMLLGWHVYLVASNKTTVEYHEGVRARRTTQVHRRGDARARAAHIYDVGLLANVQASLGQQARVRARLRAAARRCTRLVLTLSACSQPACWLLPGCSADGDGLAFETTLG